MQIDVVLRSRSVRVPTLSSALVGTFEGLGFVEKICSLGRLERYGVVYELVQV
jgi:hypothetical protein